MIVRKELGDGRRHIWISDKLSFTVDQPVFEYLCKLENVAKAAESFEKKLIQVQNDPAYIGVWAVSQNHVGPYRGPQWGDELKAFQAALAALDHP